MFLKEQFDIWFENNKESFSTMMLEEALLRAWSVGVKTERLRSISKIDRELEGWDHLPLAYDALNNMKEILKKD